jgi:hypothetical protein
MNPLRRAVASAAIAGLFVAACSPTQPDLPFEGKWNNSNSGKEGIWLFITRSEGNSYLIREAVGKSDNFGSAATAHIANGRLIYDGGTGFKELAFLDANHNTLVTVNVGYEVTFYRQP